MLLAKSTKNPLLKDSDEEPVKSAATAPGGDQKSDDKAVKIDLDGLGDRIIALPMGPGNYPGIIGMDGSVLFVQQDGLYKYDIGDDAATAIISGPIQALDVNPTRTKIAYLAFGLLGVVDMRPGQRFGDGRVDTSNVEAVVSPRDEWKQMFWETWRFERDNFYDQKMLGMNWRAIGDHYASFLPYVQNRSDLNYVLGLLVGELGTSHAYVSGGDLGPLPPPIPTAELGADYQVDGNYLKISHIYKGIAFDDTRRGPLSDPGVNVKEGDYLLAIDGKPVSSQTNPASLLIDKVGATVALTVNDKPTMAGSRTELVRPIGDETGLRYQDWIEGNRKKVAQMSGGRIGYVHVPDTSEGGEVEFVKGFYSQSDKDALIVDERFNAGGSIPTFFVDKLGWRTDMAMKTRQPNDITFPVQAVNGPKAMLINQYAGSGGDLFPWLFRERKLGPLIGTRTWGGLVGYSQPLVLSDGGTVTSPQAGGYDPATGDWIAENKGIDPDIEIDDRPDQLFRGEDPQLDKAVQVLMDQLKKGGPTRKKPEYPVVKPPKGGKGGG
jgi:tricorn protease